MKSSLIIFVFPVLLGGIFAVEDKALLQLGASENLKDVVSPGGNCSCPDGTSCCPWSMYMCCPYPNGVCCNDVYCCPSGTTCDIPHLNCKRGETPITTMIKTQLVKNLSEKSPQSMDDKAETKSGEGVVHCPDGEMICPDGMTCCQVLSGRYACCGFPNAVCCADHLHCCPSGYTCDNSTGACNRVNTPSSVLIKKQSMKIFKKSSQQQSAQKNQNVNDVVCPRGDYSCPDDMTCCPTSAGGFGCCPMPNAVCCSDELHCCPDGTTCDISGGTCNAGKTPISMLIKKRPAKNLWAKSSQSVDQGAVHCPDGEMICPDGMTCCQLPSGRYACCPLPNAVCCADRIHCCPSGTTCDNSTDTCNKGSIPVSVFVKKQPAQKRLEKSLKSMDKDIVCPGGGYACPDGTTCCPTSGGEYGCCPLPSAVCCSDGLHCCPGGTTCNLSAGTCDSDNLPISRLIKKHQSTPVPRNKQQTENKNNVKSVVCPGGRYVCPDGQTCCPSLVGTWNCCPYPSAVCCQDHYHCCPYATWCNPTTQTCNRSFIKMLMYPYNGDEAKKIEH